MPGKYNYIISTNKHKIHAQAQKETSLEHKA